MGFSAKHLQQAGHLLSQFGGAGHTRIAANDRLIHESETVISVKARLISARHWRTPETVTGLSNDVALCQSSHLALRMQDSCLKKRTPAATTAL